MGPPSAANFEISIRLPGLQNGGCESWPAVWKARGRPEALLLRGEDIAAAQAWVGRGSHWRDRAAKMRELARPVTNPEVVVLMNDLAGDYDKLAERDVIRANGISRRSNDKLP